MTDRIITKLSPQSTQYKYNIMAPKMPGNNNKANHNGQKIYPNQNLTNNKNINIIEQNYSTENYNTKKNQEKRATQGSGGRENQKINKKDHFNQDIYIIPQHTNPKTKQSATQQKSGKVKDPVDSHDLLKYFENGKIAQLSRALTNLKSDSNYYTKRYYNIQDWKAKQYEQKKPLRRVNSDPQYATVTVPPIVQKVPQTSPLQINIKQSVAKASDKNPTENFCEQKLKKKDQIVEKLKVLKQSLSQTIQLLSSEDKGNREIIKIGKIGRIQTIVNAKLQVDIKELVKLARQMM